MQNIYLFHSANKVFFLCESQCTIPDVV